MQATEHRRSQRRRPELNINTSPTGSVSTSNKVYLRDAVPVMPSPAVRRASAASKGKPPVSSSRALPPPSFSSTASSRGRESDDSFLENITPVDMANKENDPDFMTERPRKQQPDSRDSHDLSLPARQVTRDSLMSNMLMSLDQFSLGHIQTPTTRLPFEDTSNFGPLSPVSTLADDTSRTTSNNSRQGRMHSSYNQHGSAHANGHSYTYSSDFEGTDDGASKMSSQFSRGRRSNSSSNFQSSLGRINSMRETASPRHNTMASGRTLHSRGGKTSKSSSTNSIDAGYAQVLGSQRWAHGIGARSASFDMGQRPSLTSSSGANTGWGLEFSNTFWTDDHEAAPTPTVHGGPRRIEAPTHAPIAPPAPPPPVPQESDSRLDRRSTMRSRSSTAGKSSQSNSHQQPVPVMPAVDMDSAPAPHVGYEKSKDKEPAVNAPTSAAPQPKQERSGFFRKIFGLGGASDTKEAQVSAPLVETHGRPNSKAQSVGAQTKSNTSAPPSRDSQQSQPHVIQKKPSFFRRRKKSVIDAPPVPAQTYQQDIPPTPPVDKGHLKRLQLAKVEQPEPSPVSSLHQVMSPYLKGNNPGTPGGLQPPQADRGVVSPEYDVEDREGDDRRRRSRGFSPEYEPVGRPTIRSVKSHSALQNRGHESIMADAPQVPKIESPTRMPPAVPDTKDAAVRDKTFFEESSDTDGDRSNLAVPNDPSGLSMLGGFPTPPTSAPKDTSKTLSPRQPEMSEAGQPPSPSIRLDDNEIDGEQDSLRRTSLKLPIQKSRSSIRDSNGLSLPIQHQEGSSKASGSGSNTPTQSAASLPSFKVDAAETETGPSIETLGSPIDEPEVSVGEPTDDDRQKAKMIFDGNEDFIQKDRAAAWMGEEGLVRQRTLRAYMELYDFTDKSILTGLREICDRLVLRAETQQIDRILVAFSSRWCDCNPNHGFKATDVIHTMCYSIMLLNTDLHVADIEQKMTRNQFLRNTMETITEALVDAVPDAFERPSVSGKQAQLSPSEPDSAVTADREQKTNWRSSFLPPARAESRLGDNAEPEADGCGPLVKAPFTGTMRAWEDKMEVVLKEIYNSIRDERLPLFGGAPEPPAHLQAQQQNGGLSVMGMLKRSPSVLSKAPSESASARGRGVNDPLRNTGRWSTKSRSRPRLANGFSSSRTSFEDGNSLWSPAMSSATWSRQSLGRTQTSMSMDSFGSSYRHAGDYQQSIGFANALSQAIIREDAPMDSAQSIMSQESNHAALLDDESLELSGPPWVKEGIVTHKHHLDGIDKKAKDRNWAEVFAVIQKGNMSLFSFSTKSMRQKARSGRKQGPTVVGGGNWQENATNLGTFSLRQTLASALPPPGYSRARPHVWALSLPTGAVHLFQVGTPEISKEFVTTVNYWSARLSTHPLVGGISNIEYGWSDACINNALVAAINEGNAQQLPPRPGSAAAGRASTHSRTHSRQSSLRSSFEVGSSGRIKLPGDRIHISDWAPPAQSLRPSNVGEAEQLDALLNYVQGVEEELKKHNQLRSPMLLAFTPRGSNANKAMANWEKKSSYLLKEIVKFRTYVDCLQCADTRRNEIYNERSKAYRAARGEDIDTTDEDEGDTTLRPPEETET